MAGVVALLVLVPATGASAASATRQVQLLDDCDPATFNAAIGPGTCIRDGGTTFSEFVAQLLAQGGTEDLEESKLSGGCDRSWRAGPRTRSPAATKRPIITPPGLTPGWRVGVAPSPRESDPPAWLRFHGREARLGGN
jgi:hypothetical protein